MISKSPEVIALFEGISQAWANTVALPSVDDTPREPTGEMLHRIVREHLQTFLAEATHLRAGEGVPRFVEEEFQAFLSCGWLPPHHAQSAWRGPRARWRVCPVPVRCMPGRALGRLLVQGGDSVRAAADGA